MYATDYLERLVLNTLRGQAAAAPSTLYLALYLSNPGETGDGGVEMNYSGYQRQVVTFSAPEPLSGGTGIRNEQEIVFPRTSANMGTVTHLGVLDSITGGNMLLYGEVAQGLIMEANEEPVVMSGGAQWWIVNDMCEIFRKRVLNLMRGQTIPGFTPYMALYNGHPEDGGAELGGVDTGYARTAVTFAAPEDVGTGQTRISNAEKVAMPVADKAWGTWVYTVICDAAQQGQPVYAHARPSPKEVRERMRVFVDPGIMGLNIN